MSQKRRVNHPAYTDFRERIAMTRNRATKIIATLGPTSSSQAAIETLVEAGADVFRLNFSHGDHQDHTERLNAIRAIEAETGRPIGVLLDLQGPKLRTWKFENGEAELVAGERFTFDRNPEPGNASRVALPHPEIFDAVQPGELLLVDDGRLRFKVLEVSADSLLTEVLQSGVISDRKGVNVPGSALELPALTKKDLGDLQLGLELGVDWVALSFVQRPEDVLAARELIGGRAKLMAKIEKPSAVEHIDAIIAAADGIMVARGDLGVEIAPEEVPAVQKQIVRKCREAGKPVVIATQMLESMIKSPAPTRAEASDVASAVYDGVDAVMLSAESASGRYPVEAVSIMSRIIERTEADPLQRQLMQAVATNEDGNATDAIGAAIQKVADVLHLAATVTYTTSGATALRVARQRPHSPILSLAPNRHIARQLALVWGVRSHQCADAEDVEDMVQKAQAAATEDGLSQGPLAIVAGLPFGTPGSTNLLRIVWPQP
jgi:pyruvate kinase